MTLSRWPDRQCLHVQVRLRYDGGSDDSSQNCFVHQPVTDASHSAEAQAELAEKTWNATGQLLEKSLVLYKGQECPVYY